MAIKLSLVRRFRKGNHHTFRWPFPDEITRFSSSSGVNHDSIGPQRKRCFGSRLIKWNEKGTPIIHTVFRIKVYIASNHIPQLHLRSQSIEVFSPNSPNYLFIIADVKWNIGKWWNKMKSNSPGIAAQYPCPPAGSSGPHMYMAASVAPITGHPGNYTHIL